MQTEYDTTSDSKYIRLKEGKVTKTEKIHEWLLLDCAENGDVLGVEVLESSQHPLSISAIGGHLIGYNEVAFAQEVQNETDSAELIIGSQNFSEIRTKVIEQTPIAA